VRGKIVWTRGCGDRALGAWVPSWITFRRGIVRRAAVTLAVLALGTVGLVACTTPPAAPSSGITIYQRQLIVVKTASWSATTGTLQLFTRSSGDAPWTVAGGTIPINVGANGLGWGRGANPTVAGGPVKVEGDKRAPAGVFTLGNAFGSDAIPGLAIPYVETTPTQRCVDDSRSPHYNQIVDTNSTPVDWSSAEVMRQTAYARGIVVNHNVPPVAGDGSCIFLHVEGGVGVPTVGCTSMPYSTIDYLIHWLQWGDFPMLVQLPQAEYTALKTAWHLP
jgi:D-alanyl-D-alanine dipeptidase